MTAWNGNTSTYDSFGMITKIVASGTEYVHLYTADDERVWTYQTGQRLALDPPRPRRQGAQGVSERRRHLVGAARLCLPRRGALGGEDADDHRALLARPPGDAAAGDQQQRGAPRLPRVLPLRGRGDGVQPGLREDEVHGARAGLGNLGSAADDVDYMHARFYQPSWGGFCGRIRVVKSANSRAPQTWNRYTYSFNNPLNLVDPDGRSPQKFVENKQYVIEMFTHDRGHGGEHWHLYDKGGKRLLARIAADDGKVVTEWRRKAY